MEEIGSGCSSSNGGRGKLLWAAASTGQLGVGINMYRKGYSGANSQLMPLKAFSVASLFIGATATAAVSLLQSYGIHSVEDMREMGGNMRKWIRNPPRAHDN